MKVESLTLSNFTVFRSATLSLCPGVNVVIGPNGTGKTHVLKAIYSVLKAYEPNADQSGDGTDLPVRRVKSKLSSVFRPAGSLERLVRQGSSEVDARIDLVTDTGTVRFDFGAFGTANDSTTLGEHAPAVFVPSREVLSICYTLLAAYQERLLNFDETYYDLAFALQRLPLKGPRADKAKRLIAPLERIIGGTVSDQNGTFFVTGPRGTIEAHLLAEGWRKIASICRLVMNGSLLDRGLLFWDEPEANLNPRLVRPMCETLQHLANNGIQVFVATHDYLLSNELSLAAQYQALLPKERRCAIRFFALTQDEDAGVTVEAGDTLADISDNAILEEFAAHYDRERDFQDRSAEPIRRGNSAR